MDLGAVVKRTVATLRGMIETAGASVVIEGADHGLSDRASQEAYASLLTGWATEMVMDDEIAELFV